MSIDPQQLAQLQAMQQGNPNGAANPQDPMQGIDPSQLQQMMAQGQQDPNQIQPDGFEPPQQEQTEPQLDPMEVLQDVALSTSNYYLGLINRKDLDAQTQAEVVLKGAQAISQIYSLLNQPNPQADLQMKAAELQMKAQDHQMTLDHRAQEHQMNMQFKGQEQQMKLAQSQQQLQHNEVNNNQQIVQKQLQHEQQLQINEQKAKQTPQSNSSSKQRK